MKRFTYPSDSAEKKIAAISGRRIDYKAKDLQIVSEILEDVRKNGDKAVAAYTHKFDSPNVTAENLKVTAEEYKEAEKVVDKAFVRSLNRAVKQISAFHEKQAGTSWFTTPRPGVLLGQMANPVGRAGVYVPGGAGGNTPLVSSVLMTAIPAAIAGVETITMATPPRKDGSVNPHLLAAAQKAGVTEVIKAGSAWAIAALAYGTETIGRVDVIAGPGNIYVTLAKKLVAGTVGIDMIAGPSEILVVADASAVPEYVAADLLSQAEHDPLASAVLITDSADLADAVSSAIKIQLEALPRKEIAEKSLADYGAVMVVKDLKTAVDLANRVAPEHLELMVKRPFDIVGMVKNAGAVFMGSHTPEPVGDYIAGPNHVLPTAGTARFSSALSVSHFMKNTSLIHYSKSAFLDEAEDIIRLAETEGLTAHARSVSVRLKKTH